MLGDRRLARVLQRAEAADRVVQMVLRQVPDTRLEPIFDQNPHGYRLDKSAHQAVENRRKRCRK